ncbi:hypothetical protein [Escherichia coli]|nr:hypothetical protein [Escherichia coli]
MHVRSREQGRGIRGRVVVGDPWDCRVETRAWRATAAASGYPFC